MARTACAFSGQCEPDRFGPLTSDQCTVQCQGRENKEVEYLAASYNPLLALSWAPSDRVAVIYRLTKAQIHPDDSRPVLFFLAMRMYRQLLLFPELYEYLINELSSANLQQHVRSGGIVAALQYFGIADPEPDNVLRQYPPAEELEEYSRLYPQTFHRAHFDYIARHYTEPRRLSILISTRPDLATGVVNIAERWNNLQYFLVLHQQNLLHPGRRPTRYPLAVQLYEATGLHPHIPSGMVFPGDEIVTQLALEAELSDNDLLADLNLNSNPVARNVILTEWVRRKPVNLSPEEQQRYIQEVTGILAPRAETFPLYVYVRDLMYGQLVKHVEFLPYVQRAMADDVNFFIHYLNVAGTVPAYQLLLSQYPQGLNYLQLAERAAQADNLELVQRLLVVAANSDIHIRSGIHIRILYNATDAAILDLVWPPPRQIPDERFYNPALLNYIIEGGRVTEAIYLFWIATGRVDLVERCIAMGWPIPSARSMLRSDTPWHPRYLQWLEAAPLVEWEVLAEQLATTTNPIVLDTVLEPYWVGRV